jgi:hypothetical protein
MAWVRTGDTLWAPIRIAPSWRATAEGYVAHRLRALRAEPRAILLPLDAQVADDGLRVTFAPGALNGEPAVDGGTDPWPSVALPLLERLVALHASGHVGLGAPVGGSWVVPPSWFLPEGTTERFDDARREDLHRFAGWLAELGCPVPRLLAALREGDAGAVETQLTAALCAARADGPGSGGPPSFLTVLTEAELLQRMATLYRYRRISAGPSVDKGEQELTLEVDRSWRDPHLPLPHPPSPQELWDSLTEGARVTPTLAVAGRLPNPLQTRLFGASVVRWLDVHEDQPLLRVQANGVTIPDEGYLYPFSAGDNTLLRRKRAFSDFAGEHSALQPLLTSPPASRPYTKNTVERRGLEDAILDTRGVFAVQGPPGTGKTHLATAVVRRLLLRSPHARVLICAKEHHALDHIMRKIAESLEAEGVPYRAWRSLSLTRRRRGGSEGDRRWSATDVAQGLAALRHRADLDEWGTWAQRGELSQDARLTSLGRAAANLVFATTTDSALMDALGAESWDLVIVEEAGKCYPSELLHALALGRTALMIGDHRQLPPFQEKQTRAAVELWVKTLGNAMRDRGLDTALHQRFGPVYARLAAVREARPPLTPTDKEWIRPFAFLFDRLQGRYRLDEQFRMEEPLSRLIGAVFYDRPFVHRKPTLVANKRIASRPLADAIPPRLDVPLLWLNTPHMTECPDASEDRQKRGLRDNQYELDTLTAYLRTLKPGPKLDLAILTPYNAQKALLMSSRALRDACAKLTDRPLEGLIFTTDEYQGREAELVVLSMVRNNSLGQRAWGFMTEPERLNVMLSRARFRLVVVGCMAHADRHAEDNPYLGKVVAHWRGQCANPADAQIVKAAEVLHG